MKILKFIDYKFQKTALERVKRFHQLGWIVDHDSTTHFLDFIKSGYHMGWLRMNAFILVKG